MYLRTLLIVIVGGALALFTVINWQAFTMPTSLSLIFANVEAPLGLVLLGVVVLLAALFLIYVVYLQSSVLLETRRHARELDAQRKLADEAEASRISGLHAALENHFKMVTERNDTTKIELTARLEQLEDELRRSIVDCQNSLAASLGEIEDRLARDASAAQPRQLTRLPA